MSFRSLKNPVDRVGSERFEHGKWNHYQCERCGAITVTKHEDDGVTPFMLECRATAGCQGMAQSAFYRGPQHEDQKPHAIWYRCKTKADLFAAVAAMKGENREWAFEHHELGGCLLRETERSHRGGQ